MDLTTMQIQLKCDWLLTSAIPLALTHNVLFQYMLTKVISACK